ncbi:MAG TPA: ATP-binding protein [Terriglobales bacterium]|nr:ATP-binding protein [Terriglobales bacterium]
MPRLRLKTKLVLAITAMVVALVAVFAYIYVSQTVRARVNDSYSDCEFVAHEVFNAAREALEIDLNSSRIDVNNPAAVREAIQESLETDPGLNSLFQSIVGYSPIIYDTAIVDANGVALLHTDSDQQGQKLPEREEFSTVREGGFWKQIRVVYGEPKVYVVRLSLQRNGAPFGDVRVGLSTVLLKSDLEPQLNRALIFSAISIFVSLLLAAGLSNLALRPLHAIGARLDRMTAGEIDVSAEPEKPRSDEYGVVTTKIDRLGRQMRDVKEVFSALKENLDQIMANLEDGLMLFTKDARVVLVSASAEQFAGRPRGEMLGHSVYDIFTDSSPLSTLVRESFRYHESIAQVEVENANGRRVQASLDFIEERGEKIGALLTLRDAESVRKIEDEIELSRRLAAIGRLTSGVAHEVKNPINAIVVHLEVLREKLQQLDPDTRRHMDVIGSEIQRLDRVVATLVDFTRPMELRLADTDLRKILDDVASLAGPEAETHGVYIVRNMSPEPLPVKVDSDLVKQALLNVVLNGVQAMASGGTLRIAALRDDGSAQVEIQDQGGGIPADIRDKIFNLYFTTKKKGSGIGLAMTYRVMQMHNGSVDFESVDGKGTTFRLRLPLLDMRKDALEEATARS